MNIPKQIEEVINNENPKTIGLAVDVSGGIPDDTINDCIELFKEVQGRTGVVVDLIMFHTEIRQTRPIDQWTGTRRCMGGTLIDPVLEIAQNYDVVYCFTDGYMADTDVAEGKGIRFIN